MVIDSKPEAIDELDRRIMQLKIEREALKKETDKASKERLGKLEKELGRARAGVGDADRQVAGREEQARRDPDASRRSSTGCATSWRSAQRRGDLARAGEIAYGMIPELERKLAAAEDAKAAATWCRRR